LSGLVGLTPTLGIVLRNALLQKMYPLEGHVVAVVDTGYEGFIAVPPDVFESLSFGEGQRERRSLIAANGSVLAAEGAYGTFLAPNVPLKADGFIETYAGLEEVLIGVEALSQAKISLDYCTRRMKVQACL